MLELAIPAAIAIALLVPFRMPRDPIEVVAVPLVVHLFGVGWIAVGAAVSRSRSPAGAIDRPGLAVPAGSLVILLAVFHFILARGIAF